MAGKHPQPRHSFILCNMTQRTGPPGDAILNSPSINLRDHGQDLHQPPSRKGLPSLARKLIGITIPPDFR